jgi:hypothetical protein
VQQRDLLDILLSGVPSGWKAESLVADLARALAAQGASVPRITIRPVAAIPRGAAGKALLIRKCIAS